MAHFDATKSNIKNFISFTEISRVFHLQPKMAQTHLRSNSRPYQQISVFGTVRKNTHWP